MRDENAWPITLFIQIYQQIEVKIDNLTGVKPVDSFFDRFFRSIHSVAAVCDRRICQGYGGQTADVTNKNGARSNVAAFATANACWLANLFAQLEHAQNWDLRASAHRFW
jgi:hypothetical protein